MTKENINNATASIVLRTDVILSDDDFTEEAKVRFNYFSEIMNNCRLAARCILKNERLTPIGRHLFCTRLEQNFDKCKRVLNYEANRLKNQSAPPIPIRPLLVCGLPRTGTTFLYNLLACDPACRAPLILDMLVPVPPIARSDTTAQMQRNATVRASATTADIKNLDISDYEREFNASHPRHPHDEDVFLLLHTGFSVLHFMLTPQDDTELTTWFFDDTNKDFMYEYHKTFLQMLNSVDAPQSHWLFKSPLHNYYLDTFLRCYPSMPIIMTHRRLDQVIPSWIRLCLTMTSIYLKADNDNTLVMNKAMQTLDVMIDRLIKFRRSHNDTKVLDILYDDLTAQPIETVHRIYDYFGLTLSEQFESAMRNWLQENPQGKQGRNSYSLEEFGLPSNAIEQRYKEYNNMFFKASFDD